MTDVPSTLDTSPPVASRFHFAFPADARVALLVGFLAGALWGVIARAWMRIISAEHEFTWNGTLGIIIIFAVFGLGQTVAVMARRSGWRRRGRIAARVIAIATTLPMGLAAGGQMLPSLLLAAVALGRTGLHRGARVAVAALAAVPTLVVLRQLVDDLQPWRAAVGWLLMLVVYAPLVVALARALRPFEGREAAVDLG